MIKRLRKSLGLAKQSTSNSMTLNINHFFYDSAQQNSLIIFDDFLPNLLGSWRCAEIVTYLKKIPDSLLVCLLNSYETKGVLRYQDIETDKIKFIKKYGSQISIDSITLINQPEKININTRLAYCLFYNNLLQIYPLLNFHKIPFAFTLYPGGGFKLYDKNCESFLTEIKNTPLFKGVFVTQQSVYDYILERLNFDPAKVKFIYGSPMEIENYSVTTEKKYYKAGKDTLDICFVAAKYSRFGIDKGFEIFCKVASYLSKLYSFIRFHVVGGFSAEDMIYPVEETSIFFYGYRYFDWFKEFYMDIDFILSPVKSNILGVGSFDGFPTAAVIEAGLFGAAMMTADPTGDNICPGFKDDSDFFYIESNPYSIITKITLLLNNPYAIRNVALAGNKKLTSLFNTNMQVAPRIEFINAMIK
ncbi:MAG TPA: hypothetical protein VG738_03780 [Chitinophagaceae bacterium]|nr:hypothetical protein [Chitinophagaceae bacterium]